jgi:hypothetical protein
MSEKEEHEKVDEFHPRGTLVILVMFIITLIILWASVYFILLSRGVTV